jgi:uncharacterized protein YdeI (YjbR/CyaY-like superfamily)
VKRYTSVQDYLEGNQQYREELVLLRDLLIDSELEETIKWGAPCYTINGKNVIGIGAFKSYVGLWFHQGVFLKDPAKVLINASEGTTKALRQWRFKGIDDINPKLVKAYVDEAIANQREGKEIKAVKVKSVDFPDELRQAITNDKELESKFNSLTPGKQREYAEHIGSAKQEKTRISRLEKSIPLILEGKGLNDRYR